MIIKILGTGCPKCKLLQKSVEDAIKKLHVTCTLIKVDDMDDIMQYDIMALPGLVIDEKVVMTGRIPEPKEMMDLLAHRKSKKDSVGGDCCGLGSDSCSRGCSCD